MRKLHLSAFGVLLISTAACADRPTLPVEPEASTAARALGSTTAVPDAAKFETVEVTRRNEMDLTGRTHVLEFVKQGLRAMSFTHYVAGVRRATITNKWSRENGSWIVTGAEVTFYDETGREVVSRGVITRENMSSYREKIAQARRKTAFDRPNLLFGQVAGFFSPTPLAAQTLESSPGDYEIAPHYFDDARSYDDPNGLYSFDPNPYDESGLYPYLAGDAAFYAAGPNCDSKKWRMFGYLALGTVACGSGAWFPCAGAILGYWGAYDDYMANC